MTTKVSERARLATAAILRAFDLYGNSSNEAADNFRKVAAIISHHFKGHDELLAFYGAHTCAWAGAETVKAQGFARRDVEAALAEDKQ